MTMPSPYYRPPMPKFSDVLKLVEEYITAEGSAEIWHMRWALSEKLEGAFASPGQLLDQYCAQVLRAGDKLVADGKLARSGKGPGAQIIFWTPAAWADHQKAVEEGRTQRQVAREQREHVKARMSRHGYDIDKMTTEDWFRLDDELDRLKSQTSGCSGRGDLDAHPLICQDCKNDPTGACDQHRK